MRYNSEKGTFAVVLILMELTYRARLNLSAKTTRMPYYDCFSLMASVKPPCV
jgi:hypothetical protein